MLLSVRLRVFHSKLILCVVWCRGCITYRVVTNYSKTWGLWTKKTFNTSHSFSRSGIWESLSWVALAQGLKKLHSRCQLGHSHLKSWLGCRVYFQEGLGSCLVSGAGSLPHRCPHALCSWICLESDSGETRRELQCLCDLASEATRHHFCTLLPVM